MLGENLPEAMISSSDLTGVFIFWANCPGDPSSLWPMAILRFHRCASARISVSSGRLSPADLRRTSGPPAGRYQGASVSQKMHVCDCAPDLFSLPNCFVDPAIFTCGGVAVIGALAFMGMPTDRICLARFRGKRQA
jgi:hypothetical protein